MQLFAGSIVVVLRCRATDLLSRNAVNVNVTGKDSFNLNVHEFVSMNSCWECCESSCGTEQ